MMLMDFREGNPEAGAAQMPDVLEQFNAFKNAIMDGAIWTIITVF